MAVCTVSQGGGGGSVAEAAAWGLVELGELGSEPDFGLRFLPPIAVFAGPAELGSESNFVLVKSASEAARPELESDPNSATSEIACPELESDPNSATAAATASAVNAAAALPCSPPD